MIIDSLKDQSEFSCVNQNGIKFYGRFFIAIICDLKSLKSSFKRDIKADVLLGMKVSKKMGKAVMRNNIKRRMRSMLSNYSKQYNYLGERAITLIPKHSFKDAEFAELEVELARAAGFCNKRIKG